MAKRALKAAIAVSEKDPTNRNLSVPKDWRDIRISTDEAGALVKLGAERIRQLAKASWIKRVGFNEYRIGDVLDGFLAYRDDLAKQSTSDSEQVRLARIRRKEIEQRMARERGELVLIEAVEEAHAEIISILCAELAGVPAASTRDLDLRVAIEGKLNAAIERCRSRLSGAEGDLRACREPFVDAEDPEP